MWKQDRCNGILSYKTDKLIFFSFLFLFTIIFNYHSITESLYKKGILISWMLIKIKRIYAWHKKNDSN